MQLTKPLVNFMYSEPSRRKSEAMPTTRRRMTSLRAATIMDDDLLALTLEHVTVRHLFKTAAVCKVWRERSIQVFRAWRRAPSLYLVGGCGDGAHPACAQARQTVLRYDVRGDDWVQCADLHKTRDHHALVSCNGKLYALGGWSGARNRSSCECYCPVKDEWTLLSRQRLRIARSGHGAAVSDGHIFAIAGWGGAHAGFLASIESIRVAEAGSSGSGSGSNSDASSSGSTTSCTLTSGFVSDSGDASPCVALPGWTTAAAPLHLARHCPATATLGHYLYVVGGSGTDPEDASQGAQPTASVERLDTRVLCAGWRQDITAMQVPPPL